MLSENRRKQLDDIVGQMESNQENEADIQFVVDDFQNKYKSESASSPAMDDLKTTEKQKEVPPVIPQKQYSSFAEMNPRSSYNPSQPIVGAAKLTSNVAATATTGPVNAAIQGFQDAGFTPSGFGKALVTNQIRNVADPFRSGPNQIQASSSSLERMGVSNNPSDEVRAVPTYGLGPGVGQREANVHTMGNAEAGGMIADFATPVLPVAGIDLIKAAGTISRNALKGMVGFKNSKAEGLKNYVANLSQIDPAILEKASTPEGFAEIAAVAKGNVGESGHITGDFLGEKIANDINRINENRSLGYARKIADQKSKLENSLLKARRTQTGVSGDLISNIKPGESGEAINTAVESAKSPMQEAWVNGDQNSVGPLRGAKSSTTVRRLSNGKMASSQDLTSGIVRILREHKALDGGEVRNISKGAAGAGKSLIDLSEKGGKTIDDLLNIKAEIRRLRTGDKFEGNPYDNSTDDLFFGKLEREAHSTINKSILKADKKNGPDIIRLMNAKDSQYGQAKDYLGELSGSLGKTRNSTAVIQKVKLMGPQRARDFIETAKANPALAGVVPSLRQGFIDDLLISSIKNGEFEGIEFSKKWNDPKLQESKSAWLDPEVISRIDDAVHSGSQEITEPLQVGESFIRKGEADKYQAGVRVSNIGVENPINKRAMDELKILDRINKTDYARQAKALYEGKKLGMDAEGRLATDPLSATGARGYATQKGGVVGRMIGGTAGGIIGWMAGQGTGAIAGTTAGALASDIITGLHTYAASPAGAVVAYKKLNNVISTKYPKTARLSRAFDKATNVVAKNKINAEMIKAFKLENTEED